jgi:two-component system OmpR family sensor kinase
MAAAAETMDTADASGRLPGGDAEGDEFERLTAVLNGMLARIETSFERQRRFAADASHELRTPLATIKAHPSLALEDGGADLSAAEAVTALRSIDRAADRAERLVRDLLLLVRVGALPVRPESVRLSDALDEAARAATAAASAAARLRASGGPKNRAASTDLAALRLDVPDDLVLFTDRDHLLRLVGNLTENALRYTPADRSITIIARPLPGGGATVAVADTGDGIAPEHLARLGEPFYRPDASRDRKSGGTGLGLAIGKGLAAALGGTLTLESRVGVGTTATVTLPRSVGMSGGGDGGGPRPLTAGAETRTLVGSASDR